MKDLSKNLQQADSIRLVQTLSPKNDERRFYVYALCKNKNMPFYIGKGEGARVLSHFMEAKNAQAYIDQDTTLSDDEKQKRLQSLKTKLATILCEGDKCVPVIIKWGLTEEEAFMCESALINLCRFSDMELTNIANGHASELEATGGTRARTIEAFLKECAFEQKPVEELNQYSIALININKFYPKCLNNGCVDLEKVRQVVSGFWNFNNSLTIPKKIKYILAIYQMRVVGIFHVRQAFIVKETRNDNEAKKALPTFPEEVRKIDRIMFAARTFEDAKMTLTKDDYAMLSAHLNGGKEEPNTALEKFGKRAYFSLDEHGKNIPDEVLSFMGCQPTQEGNYENLAKRFSRNPIRYFFAGASKVNATISQMRTEGGALIAKVTPQLIAEALEALKKTIEEKHIIVKKGRGYQNNLFSDTMDDLLPRRQDGDGGWPRCNEIYRFWVRPTEPKDGVNGVKLTLELGPGPNQGDKQANLNSLPEESRTNMIRIGGQDFMAWQQTRKGKIFRHDLFSKQCEPTEDAIREAIADLLSKLEEWQKAAVNFSSPI